MACPRVTGDGSLEMAHLSIGYHPSIEFDSAPQFLSRIERESDW